MATAERELRPLARALLPLADPGHSPELARPAPAAEAPSAEAPSAEAPAAEAPAAAAPAEGCAVGSGWLMQRWLEQVASGAFILYTLYFMLEQVA